MNRYDHLERDLTVWFVETAAPHVPDYTDDLIRLTAGVSQRPRWSFPERWLPMSVVTLARRSLAPVPWRTIAVLAVLALLIAAMLAIYVGNRPNVPPPFGLADNGLVVYAELGDLLAIDPVTHAVTPVVDGATDDNYPTFSHDGTRIAFERNGPRGPQLFAVDAKGGVPIQLMEQDGKGIYGLTWSPDDKEIAFVNGNLWLVAADGSGAKALDLTIRTAGYPTWRPRDGADIALAGTNGIDTAADGWYLVRKDGSNLRPILKTDGQLLNDTPVLFTPDGSRILTTRDETVVLSSPVYHVHVMVLGNDGRITDDRTIGPVVLNTTIGYALSPDGTRIVAAVAETPKTWRIAVIPVNGSAGVVTTGPAFEGSGFFVGWSPDATSIIVSDTNNHQTWLLDPTGGAHRRASWNDMGRMTWQRLAR
jgi:WD40 repeat protein